MNMNWLMWAMISVILVLALVAGWMWLCVWRQAGERRRQEQSRQLQEAETEQKRLDYIYESLNVIAKSVLDGQCPMTEGCIRMAVLMDNLPLDCDTKHKFSALFEIYNATRHIPTHSRWKALDRKTQRRYQQEMLRLEKQYESAVISLMAFVKDNPFGYGQGISVN